MAFNVELPTLLPPPPHGTNGLPLGTPIVSLPLTHFFILKCYHDDYV